MPKLQKIAADFPFQRNARNGQNQVLYLLAFSHEIDDDDDDDDDDDVNSDTAQGASGASIFNSGWMSTLFCLKEQPGYRENKWYDITLAIEKMGPSPQLNNNLGASFCE